MDPRSRALRCRHAFCLFVSFPPDFSFHLSPPFSSTNSEEAKSSTWLHPGTGEAVVTGHRKTPGTRARAQRTGRLSARHGGGRNGRGRGVFFFPAAEQQPPPTAPPASHGQIIYTRPLPHPRTPTVNSPPGHFATQFLKVPSRRREPVFAGDSRSHI